MSKPDPLAHPCPQCGAEVGQKCKNYTGRGCAPHRQRLRGGALVASFETKAAKRTEAEREEAGLFAPIVRETTARDEARRWRYNVARSVEHGAELAGTSAAAFGLYWLKIHHRIRQARQLLTAEAFAEAMAKHDQMLARDAAPEQFADHWYQALRHVPGLDAQMRAEIFAKDPGHQPDDGGLAEVLARALEPKRPAPATEEPSR